MTKEKQLELAKQEKIKEIILAPFKAVFDYKEVKFYLCGEKSVVISIDNTFCLGKSFKYLCLGKSSRVKIKRDFDFSDEKEIYKIKKQIEYYLKQHRLLSFYRNCINKNEDMFLTELKKEGFDEEN